MPLLWQFLRTSTAWGGALLTGLPHPRGPAQRLYTLYLCSLEGWGIMQDRNEEGTGRILRQKERVGEGTQATSATCA